MSSPVSREEFEHLKHQLMVQASQLAELKKSRRGRFPSTSLRAGKPTPTRAIFALLLFAIPLLHAAVPHTFTAGNPAVAADVNANFTYLDEVSVPVGGIIGWHKSFAGVPALPASGKWVECNGQLLADAGSPLNGQTIPNLNGAAGGADSPGQDPGVKARLFLRGGTTSGPGEKDAFQGHWHEIGVGGAPIGSGSDGRVTSSTDPGWSNTLPDVIRAPRTDGTNGDPRTANETRPSNMAACGELGEPWCGL